MLVLGTLPIHTALLAYYGWTQSNLSPAYSFKLVHTSVASQPATSRAKLQLHYSCGKRPHLDHVMGDALV